MQRQLKPLAVLLAVLGGMSGASGLDGTSGKSPSNGLNAADGLTDADAQNGAKALNGHAAAGAGADASPGRVQTKPLMEHVTAMALGPQVQNQPAACLR